MKKSIDVLSITSTLLSWTAVLGVGGLVTVLGGGALGEYGFRGSTEAALDMLGIKDTGGIAESAGDIGFFIGTLSVLLMLAGNTRIRREVADMIR